jgi:hypothetical protein
VERRNGGQIKLAHPTKPSDERILGGGDFVESVLRDSDNRSDREKPGRMTGRSHIAVKLAIEQIQSERNEQVGVEN